MQINEHSLEGFRSDHMSTGALLALVETHVRALVRVAIGVGKSVAADALLLAAETYERFHLVFYAAPTWDILRERTVVADPEQSPVPLLILHPRPRDRCGPLDQRWSTLESRGCGTLARATLCSACLHRSDELDPCRWPDQLSDIGNVGLVVGTEQQFVNNRSLVLFLMARTGAVRPLVILDEGKLFDTQFEVEITPAELTQFKDVVLELGEENGIPARIARDTGNAIDRLLGGDLRDGPRFISRGLNRHAYRIQCAGADKCGDGFRYVGYDLVDLSWSRAEERWRDEQGVLHFTARPYLHCHLLVLSAHLSGAYVGSRLGQEPVPSPYEHHSFRHTGTGAFNLRNRTGADRYYHRNHAQILDTFATVLARNQHEGRTSVVVCRKKRKRFCAEYLAARLNRWGRQVEFLHEDHPKLPARPVPNVVPVIHYGVLGINDFTEYESIYCLDGYYVSSQVLNQAVQEFEPEALRVQLEIVTGNERLRRVRVATQGARSVDLPTLGNVYLRRLEVDPVIQAAGRVRYATRPREVVTFQMADMAREIEGCTDVGSLLELRAALGIPTAKELDRDSDRQRIQLLLDGGRTIDEVAAELGISRRTVFRRRSAGESAKNPYTTTISGFGTPPADLTAVEVES